MNVTLIRGCEVPQNLRETKFEPLYSGATQLLDSVNAPADIKDRTLRLYSGLCEYDQRFETELAPDAQTVARLGMVVVAAARPIIKGAELDEASGCSASLLHDLGKPSVGYKILQSSQTGEGWNLAYMQRMKRKHTVDGFKKALAAGLPLKVANPIHASHGKQKPIAYADKWLTYEERLIRDLFIAIPDFYSAVWGRANGRTKATTEERNELVEEDVSWVLSDYKEKSDLVPAVLEALRQSTPDDVINTAGRLSIWQTATAA